MIENWDKIGISNKKSWINGWPPQRHMSSKFRKTLDQIESLGGYIAGGYARYLVLDHFPVNDIDIFLNQWAKFEKIHELLSDLYDYNGISHYNGIQVSNYTVISKRIQVILEPRFLPIDQVERFDISVCKAYFVNNKVYMTPECINDCYNKKFHCARLESSYTQDKFNSMVSRIIKYINKGFSIDIDNLMEIYRSIRDSESKQAFVYNLKGSKDKIENWDKFEALDSICAVC